MGTIFKQAIRVLICIALILQLSLLSASAGKSDDVLRYASTREITKIDPYYTGQREAVLMIGMMVWDTLVYRNPDTGEFQPLLAKSWKWIDNVTLDVELRNDIKFHDGLPMTADDVVYTLNYIADPGNSINLRSFTKWIKQAEKKGSHSVRIHLNHPYPVALEMLASFIPILPDGFYGDQKKAGANGRLVGTGPYRLDSFEPGNSASLSLNAGYFKDSPKGKPSIGRIIYKMMPELNTQIVELMAGKIDWIWRVPDHQAQKLKRNPKLNLISEQTMRVNYLCLDAAGRAGDHPLKNVKVRRAIAHAIDRQTMARQLEGPKAMALNSPCYPTQLGCTQDVSVYEYNPGKAKQLLAEAGYPDGFEIPIYAYSKRPMVEATMGYLNAVGIKTKLNYLKWPALRELVAKGKVPLQQASWGSYSINDAHMILGYYWDGGDFDFTRDAEVTQWTKKAAESIDRQERIDLYGKALQRIADEAYWVPLFVSTTNYVFSTELDLKTWPDNNPRFFLAKWK